MSKLIGIIGNEEKAMLLANSLNIASFLKNKNPKNMEMKWKIISLEEDRRKHYENLLGIYIPRRNNDHRYNSALRVVSESIEQNFGSSMQINRLVKELPTYESAVITCISNEEEIKKIHRTNNGIIISIDRLSDLNVFAKFKMFEINKELMNSEKTLEIINDNKDLIDLL